MFLVQNNYLKPLLNFRSTELVTPVQT